MEEGNSIVIDDITKQIEFLQKFKTETVNLETKTAKEGFPKNVMILFQVFQINMEKL